MTSNHYYSREGLASFWGYFITINSNSSGRNVYVPRIFKESLNSQGMSNLVYGRIGYFSGGQCLIIGGGFRNTGLVDFCREVVTSCGGFI